MMDALPEECDVHGDAYEHIKIEDFGKGGAGAAWGGTARTMWTRPST